VPFPGPVLPLGLRPRDAHARDWPGVTRLSNNAERESFDQRCHCRNHRGTEEDTTILGGECYEIRLPIAMPYEGGAVIKGLAVFVAVSMAVTKPLSSLVT
jgi:hypothetical protein